MKNWAFALAAGLVLIVGCSGSGGGNGGGGNGGNGGNGESTAQVNLPNVPGVLEHIFLTGQGRAQGDLSAVVNKVAVEDQFGYFPKLVSPPLALQLNGYTHNIATQDVLTTNSREFDVYDLNVLQLLQDNGDGSSTTYGDGVNPIVEEQFPAYFRMFPARTTQMSIRLDDSMFNPNNNPAFDKNQFEIINEFSFQGNPSRMNGFLADYVYFDLSALGASDQPDIPDPNIGGKATALWMSGDSFAIGIKAPGAEDHAPPDAYPFIVLTPSGYASGLHVGERTGTDTNGNPILIPGTYSIVQDDPRDNDPVHKITALMGPYKSFKKTITGYGQSTDHFEIIAFPSTFDDGVDDIVLFNYVGGQITKLYFGQMDLTAGTISAFPVNQITDPTNVQNEVTGTVSGLVDGFGSTTTDVQKVKVGHYTLNAPNRPPTFSASGRFIVYRR